MLCPELQATTAPGKVLTISSELVADKDVQFGWRGVLLEFFVCRGILNIQ
jgi:hypothetical protein